MKKPNHDMWKERWCGREKFNGLSFIALFSLRASKKRPTRRRSSRRARADPSVHSHTHAHARAHTHTKRKEKTTRTPVFFFLARRTRSLHRDRARVRPLDRMHPSDTRNDTRRRHPSSSSFAFARVPIHRNAKRLRHRRHDRSMRVADRGTICVVVVRAFARARRQVPVEQCRSHRRIASVDGWVGENAIDRWTDQRARRDDVSCPDRERRVFYHR